VAADILALGDHISGQTPLHARRPLPAVLNGELVRGMGDSPAASLRICRGDVGKRVANCSTRNHGQIRPTPR
jgi:hypothetical protein